MAEVDGSIRSQGRPGGVLLFGPYHGGMEGKYKYCLQVHCNLTNSTELDEEKLWEDYGSSSV